MDAAVLRVLGLVFLAAFTIGGDVGGACGRSASWPRSGALFLFGFRSETLRGLAGPGRDERWAGIDIRATAFAGMVTVAVVLGALVYEIAHGNDGSPYGRDRRRLRDRLHRGGRAAAPASAEPVLLAR